jgi:hypothetical protein
MVAEAPKEGQRPFLGAVAEAQEFIVNRLVGVLFINM